MYPNIRAEMARNGINGVVLAELAHIPYATLTSKMTGKTDWKLSEAIAVKRAIGTAIPLEELFKKAVHE